MKKHSVYVSVILIALLLLPASTRASVFFSDSFESGDLSYVGSNGANWTSSKNVTVSSDRSYSGSHSLKFTFPGSSDLTKDSSAEQRFSFSEQLDEAYIQFYVYFPSDYVLRSTPSTENSKLMYLWGDDYNLDMNKVGVEFEPSLIGRPKAKISNASNSNTCSGSTGYMKGISGTGINIGASRGKWTKIQMHIKRDTGSGNGAFNIWQDGTQVIFGNNITWVGAPCGLNKFFRNGYLMGWSNAGFNQNTVVYIDDVVFSDSYIGTGSTPAPIPDPTPAVDTTPPSAPTGFVVR